MTSFGSNLNQELGAKRATTTIYHLISLREVVLILPGTICLSFVTSLHYPNCTVKPNPSLHRPITALHLVNHTSFHISLYPSSTS